MSELPPLYETIDLDALEALVESFSSPAASVTFSYLGFTVHVDADRTVTLARN